MKPMISNATLLCPYVVEIYQVLFVDAPAAGEKILREMLRDNYLFMLYDYVRLLDIKHCIP